MRIHIGEWVDCDASYTVNLDLAKGEMRSKVYNKSELLKIRKIILDDCLGPNDDALLMNFIEDPLGVADARLK